VILEILKASSGHWKGYSLKLEACMKNFGTHPPLPVCFSGGVEFEYHHRRALFTHVSTMRCATKRVSAFLQIKAVAILRSGEPVRS